MFLFTKNNFIQLRRKWISLPLLLLLPIITIGLIVTIIVAFFSPPDSKPIKVGIVDLDKSEETQLVVEMIDETSQLGDYIKLANMSENEAINGINKNRISSYIELPKNFTKNLYNGTPVTIPIKGNPNQVTESHLIKELIDSVARHIRTSQANILTINHFAKALAIDDETRHDMLFEQFKNFLFYTIGKDKLIDQKELKNQATSSPTDYFSIASWFITISIWIFIIYTFLHREETQRIKTRMKLYGVIELHQIFARMLVTLLVTALFAIISFAILNYSLSFQVWGANYLRISIIMGLYSILLLITFAVIETLIAAMKLRLFLQLTILGIILMLSGSFIPSLYYPLQIQSFMPYIFSSVTFHWLQEIVLNGRYYADYLPLLLMNGAGLLILMGLSLGKERVQQ